MADQLGIVSYIGDAGDHQCGYCKSSAGFATHGMLAYKLTCQNLQDLTDRGWRRSGQYCYLPTNDRMCCPLYIIRCEAEKFVPSKSQKKVLKTMKRFLMTGEKKQKDEIINEQPHTGASSDTISSGVETKKTVKPGKGADPTKPPCRKAKDIRRERKLLKQAEKASIPADSSTQPHTTAVESAAQLTPSAVPTEVIDKNPSPKSLEEFLQLPCSDKPPAHKLEMKLVRSSPRSEEFKATFKESFELYKKYQIAVHHDKPSKLTESQYVQFLVDSPLIPAPGPEGWECGYGSYHNQYYIDGKLVMVGVIDILPNCASSVYVYYDTDYNFLSPGVYSALYEISLVRRLHAVRSELAFYCMGYYVHSCQKMRYKGDYSHSFLLCSETHQYVPIERCRPKLDAHKYSRFSDESVPEDDVESFINSVLVLSRHQAMTYEVYRHVAGHSKDSLVKEYARKVGKNMCNSCLLLFR